MMGMAGPYLVPVEQVRFWSSKQPSTTRYIGRTALCTQYNDMAVQLYSKDVPWRLNKKVVQAGSHMRTMPEGLATQIFSSYYVSCQHTHICVMSNHPQRRRDEIFGSKDINEHGTRLPLGISNDIKSTTYDILCASAHGGHGWTIATPCRTGEILVQ